MSKKTVSQMEAVLMERIEKARLQLEKLQQKQKAEIGTLAVKHGLHKIDMKKLDFAFSRLAEELGNDHPAGN